MRYQTARELFIGRDAELAALASALDDAAAGEGRTVLVGGEPGIGKTRLSEEFAERAERRGVTTYWARCHGGDSAPPFWPWNRLLSRALTREAPPPERLRAPLFRLFPALAPEPRPTADPADLTTPPERFALFSAVADVLAFWAAERPLMLIFDNLHLADASSLLLFDFVARETADAALLLLGAYRNTELMAEGPLQAFVAMPPPNAMHLTLRGLGADEIQGLVTALAPARPVASLAALIRDTAGNPMFITELVRLQEESGAATGTAGSPVLPATIRDAVARRLAGVSPSCQETLTWAAICGDEVSIDLLSAIQPAPTLEHDLAEAERRGLIEPIAPGGQTHFAHGLVRDTLYAAVPPRQRAEMHQHIATTIETLWGTHPDHLVQLAGHALRAGFAGGEHAVELARLAGDEAMQRFAYEEAARWYAAALDRHPNHAAEDEITRLDLLLALAEAQNRAGEAERARDTFRRAVRQSTRLEAPYHLARAALGLGNLTISGGVVEIRDHLVAHLEAALRMLPAERSPVRVQVMARLARALHFSPNRARAEAISREAVTAARALGEAHTLALALSARRRVVSGPDTLAERVALTEEISRLTSTTGDIDREMDAAQWRMTDLLEVGDTVAADGVLAAYTARAETLRQPYYRWWAAIWRAMRAMEHEHAQEAERLIEQAQATRGQGRDPDALLVFKHQIFALRRQQGRLEEIAGLIEADVATYAGLPRYRARLALLYAETARTTDARRLFEELAVDAEGSGFAALPRDGLWLSALAYLTDVCVALADRERAPLLYDLLLPYAGRAVVVATGVVRDGVVDRLLGQLAALLGSSGAACRHFADAVALHERMGAHWWAAWSRFGWGKLLGRSPRLAERSHGTALIVEAHHAARALGLDRLAALCDAELERANHQSQDPHQRGHESRGPAAHHGGTGMLDERIAALERELEQVRAAAYQDALTGLANRTAWDQELDSAFSVETDGRPAALLMLDLDNLKTINDTFGHAAGDRALRDVADRLREHLGPDAFIARYGGDEFAVLFTGSTVGAAAARTATLLAVLGNSAEPSSATLSAGLAHAVPGDTPADLFRRADAALYAAKRAGRNQLTVAAGG